MQWRQPPEGAITPMSANIEWQHWGKTDPLFGVCSWPGRRRTDSNPWTEEEFYAVGAADWQDYLRQWEQYGVISDSCVEIGCGAGRMTRAMVSYFRQIHAVDVSPDMIAYARRAVGQSSVTFHITDGRTLPLPDRSVTAAFSTLVFRHLDRITDAYVYFNEIYRILVDGGSFIVELPIYCWPTMHRTFSLIYGIRKALGQLRATFRRYWLRRGIGQPFMRALIYDLNWLQTTLASIGFTDIEARIFPIQSYQMNWHTTVLARKPMIPTT